MLIFHEQEENIQGTTYCFEHTPQSPPATTSLTISSSGSRIWTKNKEENGEVDLIQLAMFIYQSYACKCLIFCEILMVPQFSGYHKTSKSKSDCCCPTLAAECKAYHISQAYKLKSILLTCEQVLQAPHRHFLLPTLLQLLLGEQRLQPLL